MPGRLPADRLAQNLAALKKAQPEYWEWLNAADSQNLVELTQALDGAPILIVDGQSQDSRRTPEDRAWATLKSQLAAAEGPGDLGPGPGEGLRPKEAEAKATIEDPGPLAGQSRAQRAALGRPLWLFGLGSPLALWRLLRETSAAAGPVNLYEPRAAVALKGLSALDFSAAIAEGNLVFWAPQDLIDRAPTPKSLLLFHPPSARGQKSQFERLSAFLTGRDRRALPKGRAPKILIAGPLSGGPESMGPALLRAGLALNYPTELLRWSDEARDLAGQAQKGDPAAARGLLALAALEAKRALAAFKPDLTVALAQAPFDGPTVVELKKESDSLFALWFVEDFRVFGYAAEVAPAYDLFFHIQGPYLADRARLWGLGRAYYLPPAADPGLFRPQSQVPLKYRAL
ncbi:MAG: DUF3880 domain-containing protein, partial [Deltaproteobacteria bacterium]|nr:DUF3880 domain-containing protein [Deltaproteobacteria bacterium]